jgi:uncharacterized membrane protein YdfJ with MMPL/SSD domain
MNAFMADAAARAAVCVALAGLLMVYPSFLAYFLAAVLVGYAVVNARLVWRQLNRLGSGIARVFAEVSSHDNSSP